MQHAARLAGGQKERSVNKAAATSLRARLLALTLLAALGSGLLLAASAAPAPLLASPRVAAAQSAAPPVQRVEMIGFTVSDLARSVRFFTELLDFALVDRFEVNDREYDVLEGVFGANARVAHVRLGEQVVELTQYLTPQGRPIPVPSGSNDLWFEHVAIVVSDLDAAVARVKAAGVAQISPEAITIPPSNVPAAGIGAFKFRDPDGHPLELIYFPPDKRAAAWQQTDGRLFLGIDHTAMSIGDTARSLQYYEPLGLVVGGRSFNSGLSQELLDNLFGDTVLVTAIQPPVFPPHVELLGYLTPPTARPFPPDTTAADLWHWQTTFLVDDADRAFDQLRQAGSRFVSPRVVTVGEPRLGFRRGFMVRDPDGHALRLVQR
jgi:catechol 2,3-dioxygenase-like lactoylglutathione lyase family enzyme